jgi:Fe-S-cluster containining protein
MQEQPLPVCTGATGNPSTIVKSFRCDSCGLCCRRLLVEADWSDVLREPRIAQECPNHGAKLPPVLEQCWLLYSDAKAGACPFLGDDQKCGIYPTRPNTCVTFAAGSPKCQELRTEAGLPPLAAVPGASGIEYPGAGDNLTDQINAAVIDYNRTESL